MRKILYILLLLSPLALLSGCFFSVKYSLSGASIPTAAQTFSVQYFPNNAAMVSTILSSTMTDELSTIFQQRTRLTEVSENGDFAFEGEIIGYTSTTSSVSSDDYALMNRLTITVRVRFTNMIDDSKSFSKNYTAFQDYDSTQLLNEVEDTLVPEIVEEIVLNIFQDSATDW